MSFLSKLFGGGGGGSGGSADTPPESHDGFSIYVEPQRDGPRWRIAARIQKEIDGEVKEHHMLRADTLDSQDAAAEATLRKAKSLIDQQGISIFD
ncbi:MAG: HlyU family transcriptional regulator [Pseudomonadota bacterium]